VLLCQIQPEMDALLSTATDDDSPPKSGGILRYSVDYSPAGKRVSGRMRSGSTLLHYLVKFEAGILSTGGSVAEWLACWTRAQKGPGSNRCRDSVG